jgi:hypothetical protein
MLIIKDPKNILDINNTYGKLSKSGGESVSATFSKFLDMHSIRPAVKITLPSKLEIKAYLGGPFFDFITDGMSVRKLSLSSWSSKTKVQTTRVESFYELRNAKIVYAEHSTMGPKLVTHLLGKFDVSSLIYVRPSPAGSFDRSLPVKFGGVETFNSDVQDYTKDLFKQYSDLYLDNYDVDYDEEEEDLEKEQETTTESLALIRKANKEVLYTTYDSSIQNFYCSKRVNQPGSWGEGLSTRQIKHTIKIADLESKFNGEDKKELVICTGKYKDLGKIVDLCATLFKSNTQVIYVAQDVVPYFTPYGTVISDYFRKIDEKTGQLMIGSQIRNLNTWRLLHEIVHSNADIATNFEMLEGFSNINVELFKKVYYNSRNVTDPKDIILRSTGSTFTEQVVDDVFGYLDALLEFQKVVRTADEALIAETALKLFQSSEIYDLDAYDEELIHGIRSEFKRLEPIRPLLAVCNDSGDFNAAKPLIELLLKTLNTQENVNI